MDNTMVPPEPASARAHASIIVIISKHVFMIVPQFESKLRPLRPMEGNKSAENFQVRNRQATPEIRLSLKNSMLFSGIVEGEKDSFSRTEHQAAYFVVSFWK
jgi:hypothetical protein